MSGFFSKVWDFLTATGESGAYHDDSSNVFDHTNSSVTEFNPATGLPMLEDSGIDVAGNPYGIDNSHDYASQPDYSWTDSSVGHDDSWNSASNHDDAWSSSSSSFDDSWSSSSSSFDDSWSSSSSSFDDSWS